jgi:chaperonin GroES
MELKPLHDRVVVRALDQETRSPGGIVIPDNAKEKPTTGEVLAVGPGRITDDGTNIPVTVRVGDRVLFGQYAGQKVKINGEEVSILREEDVLAVLA